MASRTIGDARFDQGAQYVEGHDPALREQVADWERAGVATAWFRAAGSSGATEVSVVGVGGMRSIPELLAVGLDVRTSTTLTSIERSGTGIVARVADGSSIEATGAVLTPPLPQLLALVDAGGIELPRLLLSRLEAVGYDACLAVMARLDAPSRLPGGHRSLVEGPIAWLGDNQHKGTSATPSLTVLSSAAFAADHLDGDPDDWTKRLIAAAAEHVASPIVEATGHRWRYAEPRTTFDDGAIPLEDGAPVVLAGEVFAGGRVEGAVRSGFAAAERILAAR